MKGRIFIGDGGKAFFIGDGEENTSMGGGGKHLPREMEGNISLGHGGEERPFLGVELWLSGLQEEQVQQL